MHLCACACPRARVHVCMCGGRPWGQPCLCNSPWGSRSLSLLSQPFIVLEVLLLHTPGPLTARQWADASHDNLPTPSRHTGGQGKQSFESSLSLFVEGQKPPPASPAPLWRTHVDPLLPPSPSHLEVFSQLSGQTPMISPGSRLRVFGSL